MGIDGLSSYVNKTGGLLRETQLKETKIVIDGSSLLWELYISEGIDYQHGGNYDQLAKVISKFFEALKSNRVKPYVVIDGPTAAKDKKLETIKKRFANEIDKNYKLSKGHVDKDQCFLLPLMTKGVFIQELKNLGIPFVVCDCEADQEVASLANHWSCPAISNDSDYFIFDLPAGYIPLKSLVWKGKPITGKLYKRQRLADYLEIPPEFLPLVASLLGNDFIEDSTLAPFEKALFSGRRGKHPFSKKISAIVELLFSSQNLEAALECALVIISGESNRTRLRAALKESIKEYSICDFTLNEFFELRQIRTSLKTMNDEDIPSLVMERYREGMFPVKYMGVLTSGRHFLHNQVEKSDECSAHVCSHELREIIYDIILKPMQGREAEREGVRVKVWSRNRRNIKKSTVRPLWEPVDGYGELPRLDVLKETKIEERRQLLLTVLKANTARIKSLPERFQLFAASVRYWISKANPGVTKIWVKALLLGHLKLLVKSEDADKPPPKATDLRSDSDDCQQSSGQWQTMPKASGSKKSSSSDFDIDCQHSFAQWQAVMMETIYLNQILLDPFDEPRISTLYSGVMAHSIAREIKQGKKVKSFVTTKDIFKQLYAAVKDVLVINLPQEKGINEPNVEPSEHKTAKKRRDKKPPPVLDGNPFALLRAQGSEDES